MYDLYDKDNKDVGSYKEPPRQELRKGKYDWLKDEKRKTKVYQDGAWIWERDLHMKREKEYNAY